MIELVGIWQHYGIRPVLRDINLRVEGGELMAVMGANGVGKSTMLGVMAGALYPQRGHVMIDGIRRRINERDELEIRRRVYYLPDQPWLPDRMTGREVLLRIGRLWEVEDFRLMEHIERLLELFTLASKADGLISGYSSGQRKKIELATALVTEAPILILDEPFSGGLDPAGIVAMKNVLVRLAAEPERTIVFATPVPELVEELAHRIAVMDGGTLLAVDTPEGLRRLTGCDGPLEEVLERLLSPHTRQHVEHYFEVPKS